MDSEHSEIEKRLIEGHNYFSITDLALGKSKQKPNEVLRSWINNPDTIEFVEVWERNQNPNFKADSFIRFKINHYNSKRFVGVHEFIRRTHTKGLISPSGRFGGVFAHVDIALEFVLWLDPTLRLEMIQFFQSARLSEKKKKHPHTLSQFFLDLK